MKWCVMHKKYFLLQDIKWNTFFPNLFPRDKKYGRPTGGSNQYHREHLRRIRTRHPRDERTTGQINKVGWGSHQNYNDRFPISITFASSTGPSLVPISPLPKSSTIHPSHEQYFIENLLSQPMTSYAHSNNHASFCDSTPIFRSAKQLKGQT